MIDWFAAGVIWGLVMFGFWRGYHKHRRISRFVVLTWTIFMSLALVFTLRIRAVGTFLDGKVGDHPVTYFLNALFTLTAAGLYAVSLAMFQDDSTPDVPLHPYHWRLIYAAFGVVVLLCLSLAGSFRAFISYTETFLLMRFVLSVYLLMLIMGMLVPFNWWMFRREQVFPMRCKHLALIVGLCVYASGAVIAVLMNPLHLLAGGKMLPTHAAYMENLLNTLSLLVLIMGMLVPLNWWVFRRKQVFPMFHNRLAATVFVSGVMFAVLMMSLYLLVGQTLPNYAAPLRGVVGILCLLVILMPHRWIVMILLPEKLSLYRRIARVERWITARVAEPQVVLSLRQALSPLSVDHTTYLAVINIMDYYRAIPPEDVQGQAVARQIQAIWPAHPQYDDLVKALSRVTL